MNSDKILLVIYPSKYLIHLFYQANLYKATLFCQYLLYQYLLNVCVYKKKIINTIVIKKQGFFPFFYNLKKDEINFLCSFFSFYDNSFIIPLVFVYLFQAYFDLHLFHIFFLCFFPLLDISLFLFLPCYFNLYLLFSQYCFAFSNNLYFFDNKHPFFLILRQEKKL